MLFPSSAEAGPHQTHGVLQTGFADSDLGAALAAVHIVYRASPAPGPATFRAALARQVTGPAVFELAETVESDYTQARVASGLPSGAPLGAGTVTFTGYVVTPLPDGNRHVEVLERAPDANGVLQTFSLDVVVTHVNGDWRVVAPSDGTWASAVSQLAAEPDGVTPFSPPAPGTS